MKHVCDDCFAQLSGSVEVVPDTIAPTAPVYCANCLCARSGGIDIMDLPYSSNPRPEVPLWVVVSGSA